MNAVNLYVRNYNDGFDIGGGIVSQRVLNITGGNLNYVLSGTSTITVPAATDTMALLAASQTLTNKTIDAASNTISNIANSNIATNANIANSKLADSGVVAGTYGTSTKVAQVVVNAKGIITGISEVTITASGVGAIGGTIALNQVAYGSGANTIQGSTTFIFDGTSLGIGTTSPADKLHIAGAGSIRVASLTASRALVTDANSSLAVSAVTSTELGYVSGVTSAIQTQLNNKQGLDATLTALAAFNTNGLLTQTAADTFTGRTITGTTNYISVTNGDGVSGNPTINIGANVMTTDTTQSSISGAKTFTTTVTINGSGNLANGLLNITSSSTGNDGTLAKFGPQNYLNVDASINQYINWGARYDGDANAWVRTYTAANNYLPFIKLGASSTIEIGGASSNLSTDAAPTLTSKFYFDIANGRIGVGTATVGDSIHVQTGSVRITSLTASRAIVTDANSSLAVSAVTSTELGYVSGVTSAIQTQLNNKQGLDATLTALAAYNTNGILVQTAADTFAGRTLTGTTNRITVTNGDGVAGNPTVDISSSYVGQATITTLGTIATGTWQGTAIASGYGGTGFTTYAAGDLIYASAINTLSKLTIGSTNQVLSVVGGVPTWSSISSIGIGGTIATGQVAYGSGSNTITGATTFIYSGGNLGVGTTNPTQKLHVEGNVLATALYSGSVAAPSFSGVTVGYGTASPDIVSVETSGEAGVGAYINNGTTNHRVKLFVDATNGKWGLFQNNTDAGIGMLARALVNQASGSAIPFVIAMGNNEYMRILPDGGIGIGTTAPTQDLHVQGAVRITGALYDNANSAGTNGYVLQSTGSGFQWVSTANLGGAVDGTGTANYLPRWSDTNTLTNSGIIEVTGNFGIGTATPGDKLHLQTGSIRITSLTASRALITDANSSLAVSAVTSTELGYVSGVTSAIQTQLNNKQGLDATLTALAAYNTNGILVQTAADTFAGRTLTGTTNRITVTNGDGVSGNPTVDISSSYVGQATITTLGTISTGTWQGTTIASGYGGTGFTTYATGDLIYASATNTLSKLTVGSTGQVLTVSGGAPSWQNTTSLGIVSYTIVTGTTQTAAVNNGYITNNVAQVTITLPTTAAVGSIIKVIGYGAGGWKIAQNAGQSIRGGFKTSTTGATGYMTNGPDSVWDAVELLCVVANNEWMVVSVQGNPVLA